MEIESGPKPGTMSVKSKVRSGNANANANARITKPQPHTRGDEPTGLKSSGIPHVIFYRKMRLSSINKSLLL